MILEVRHLRLIAAVADCGSLTKAGQQIHLTQSGLSHQLIDLEDRLGTPLFHRLGKRMVPTPAGLRVLEVARQMLPRLSAAEDEVRLMAAGRTAVLRLSTECYTCYHWLPRVLDVFGERFPNVDVQIVADATYQTTGALLEGRIDLGIVTDDPGDERLVTLPLFDDELLMIVAPTHPLATRPFARPEDFTEEHLLVYTLPLHTQVFVREVLEPAGAMPRRVSAIQLTEAIIEMVRAGRGVAVLARWAVAPHLAAGTVVGVPLTERGFRRHWLAAFVRQDPVPLHLREFIQVVAANPPSQSRTPRRASA